MTDEEWAQRLLTIRQQSIALARKLRVGTATAADKDALLLRLSVLVLNTED